MPKHLSLATVVEKNKIASTVAFIMLLEVDVVSNVTGLVIETQYLARNNEDVTYQGQVYTSTAFKFEVEESAEGVPEVSVVINDPTGRVMSKVEAYGGGVGWKVRMKYVNTGNLDQPPEIEELVYILATKAENYVVEFTLGARNPLSQRFPRRMQWRDRCGWVYKGAECGYAGPEATCDYSLQGGNGCSAKGNEHRFGGLPGIRPRS